MAFAEAGRVFLLLLQLLFCCSADDLICTVSQHGDSTCYSITGNSDVNLKGCPFSWLNGTDHVIANEGGQMDGLVMDKSIHHLITSKCGNISYSRHCTGEAYESTAMCNTICPEIPHDKGHGMTSDKIIALVASLLVVMGMVVMGGVWFVCCKGNQKSTAAAPPTMRRTPQNV